MKSKSNMITEKEKNEALELIERYELQQRHQVRENIENDCPSEGFEKGIPNGECEGDGHYMCKECIKYKS